MRNEAEIAREQTKREMDEALMALEKSKQELQRAQTNQELQRTLLQAQSEKDSDKAIIFYCFIS